MTNFISDHTQTYIPHDPESAWDSSIFLIWITVEVTDLDSEFYVLVALSSTPGTHNTGAHKHFWICFTCVIFKKWQDKHEASIFRPLPYMVERNLRGNPRMADLSYWSVRKIWKCGGLQLNHKTMKGVKAMAAWGTVKAASGCKAADVTFIWVSSQTVLLFFWGRTRLQILGGGAGRL